MTIIERIYNLLEMNNKKPSELADYLNLSSGQMSNWKKRNTDPPAKYIHDICNFFDVTTDYLLTGKDPTPFELTSDQQKILQLWNKLDPVEKAEFKGELKGYIKAKEGK